MAIDITKLDLAKVANIYKEIDNIDTIIETQNKVVTKYDAYFNSEIKQNLGIIMDLLKSKFEELNEAYKICITPSNVANPAPAPSESNMAQSALSSTNSNENYSSNDETSDNENN